MQHLFNMETLYIPPLIFPKKIPTIKNRIYLKKKKKPAGSSIKRNPLLNVENFGDQGPFGRGT